MTRSSRPPGRSTQSQRIRAQNEKAKKPCTHALRIQHTPCLVWTGHGASGLPDLHTRTPIYGHQITGQHGTTRLQISKQLRQNLEWKRKAKSIPTHKRKLNTHNSFLAVFCLWFLFATTIIVCGCGTLGVRLLFDCCCSTLFHLLLARRGAFAFTSLDALLT